MFFVVPLLGGVYRAENWCKSRGIKTTLKDSLGGLKSPSGFLLIVFHVCCPFCGPFFVGVLFCHVDSDALHVDFEAPLLPTRAKRSKAGSLEEDPTSTWPETLTLFRKVTKS